MASDEETVLHRKRRKKPIITDDSDSDSEPCVVRPNRRRCNRVYVSDGEVSSTVPFTNCGDADSSDHKSNLIRNWSEGDEQSSDGSESGISGNSDAESADSDDSGQYESESSSSAESGDEELPDDTNNKTNDATISSDSDSGPDGQSEKCPVCLSKFKEQEIGTPESCDHNFCLDCILEWSRKVTTCPIDRQNFTLILVREKPESEIIRRVPIAKSKSEITIEVEVQPEDMTVCEICGSGDHEERLLLCDGCDLGYHCDCLSPPLEEVPIEEWFCPYCADQVNQESDRVAADDARSSNRRLTVSVQPVIRRIIARTRASEMVRERVRRTRRARTINNNQPSTSSAPQTKRTIKKRKTTRRRKRKTTKTSSTSKTKGKSLTKASSVKRIKRRRRRRRKGARKSSKRLSKYVKIPSIRKRVANKLGICKSKGPKHAMPMIKKSRCSYSEAGNNGVLSLFGDRDDVTNYDQYNSSSDEGGLFEVGDGASVSLMGRTAHARTSHARKLVKEGMLSVEKSTSLIIPSSNSRNSSRRTIGISSGPVDLLSSILKDQSVLHSSGQDVLVKRDGSLRSNSNDVIQLPSSSTQIGRQRAMNKVANGSSSPKASASPKSQSRSSEAATSGSVTTHNYEKAPESASSGSGSGSSEITSSDQGISSSGDKIPCQNNSNIISEKSKEKKKKLETGDDEKDSDDDVNLYSDIENGDGDYTANNQLPIYPAARIQDNQDSGDDVEPSYSPIVGTDTSSDDELIIDESKEQKADNVGKECKEGAINKNSSALENNANENSDENMIVSSTFVENVDDAPDLAEVNNKTDQVELTNNNLNLSDIDTESLNDDEKEVEASKNDFKSIYNADNISVSSTIVKSLAESENFSDINQINEESDRNSPTSTQPNVDDIQVSNPENTDDKPAAERSSRENSLELEGISDNDDQAYNSDSDSEPSVPSEMDFQLCKDNVFESLTHDNDNTNSEIQNIQDMLSPISAAASSTKESNNDADLCDKQFTKENDPPFYGEMEINDEELIIREKTHSQDSSRFHKSSFRREDDDGNVNWKKLSQSTKVRSYRDGKPRDRETYFQDREIKKKRRPEVEPMIAAAMLKSNKYGAHSKIGSKRASESNRYPSDSESKNKRSRRDRSRYSPRRSRSHNRSRSRDRSRQKLRKHTPEKSRERSSSGSDSRRHRRKHKHYHIEKQKSSKVDSRHSPERRRQSRRHRSPSDDQQTRRKSGHSSRSSHNEKHSEADSKRSRIRRRTGEDKEVIASGDNITVKVNFGNQKQRSASYNERTPERKLRSKHHRSESRLEETDDQIQDEQDIIVLSSPSLSSCSVYTVEDSDAEQRQTTPDINRQIVCETESVSPTEVDARPDVRKVVIEENAVENDSGPTGIKIVVSCDTTERKDQSDVENVLAEPPAKSAEETTTEVSMTEEYDPFEPTNSPSSPDPIDEFNKAPPLPEFPPLPPEPPEEAIAKPPALPSEEKQPYQPNVQPMTNQVNCQNNWSMSAPPPRHMPPNMLHHPAANRGGLLIPPISSSMFSRPPPSLNSAPIRIIPPTVLPSLAHPPPPLIPKLPHSLNVPPPNINQNMHMKAPPNPVVNPPPMSQPISSPYQKNKRDVPYKTAEDVTDVVDMELDTSPYSNEENNQLLTAAKPVNQPTNAKLASAQPKSSNEMKIDSLLLSLVVNKEILNTLAKKAVSTGPSAKVKKKTKSHSRQLQILNQLCKPSTPDKRKHANSKSPRKTGPRTPESDSNEPQEEKHVRNSVSRHSSDDKKKHKSSSYKYSGGTNLSLDDHKKGIGVKIGEDSLHVIDDVPNSAVEMQVKEKFLKKLNRQERVIEEVKLALKPYYHKRDIGKDDYKEIMRKAVPKVCHNKAGEINPLRIKSLIEGYVKKCKHQRKKKSALPSSTT